MVDTIKCELFMTQSCNADFTNGCYFFLTYGFLDSTPKLLSIFYSLVIIGTINQFIGFCVF